MNEYLADDNFQSEDKAVHLLLGMLLAILVRHYVWAGWQTGIFAIVVLGWEVFEFLRWRAWQAKAAPAPRPWACDLLSWRDVVAGCAGGLLAAVLRL